MDIELMLVTIAGILGGCWITVSSTRSSGKKKKALPSNKATAIPIKKEYSNSYSSELQQRIEQKHLEEIRRMVDIPPIEIKGWIRELRRNHNAYGVYFNKINGRSYVYGGIPRYCPYNNILSVSFKFQGDCCNSFVITVNINLDDYTSSLHLRRTKKSEESLPTNPLLFDTYDY